MPAGFCRAGRADEQDIRFRQLDIVRGFRVAQAFVVVVHRNRKGFFRLLLADDMVVEVGDDFGGGGQFAVGRSPRACGGGVFRVQHHTAGFHAFVADAGVGFTLNQVFHFLFGFAAKGAVAVFCGHGFYPRMATVRPSEKVVII